MEFNYANGSISGDAEREVPPKAWASIIALWSPGRIVTLSVGTPGRAILQPDTLSCLRRIVFRSVLFANCHDTLALLFFNLFNKPQDLTCQQWIWNKQKASVFAYLHPELHKIPRGNSFWTYNTNNLFIYNNLTHPTFQIDQLNVSTLCVFKNDL